MATSKINQAKAVVTSAVVSKSNKLVEACYRLDLVELRVLMMAIYLGRVNDLLAAGPGHDVCAPIRIEASLFTEHFPMGEQAVFAQLQKATKALNRKPLSAIEAIRGVDCPVDIPWFTKSVYLKHEAAIEVEINRHVLPYITQLETEFTTVRLERMGRLTSVYAVRLYEMLHQYLSLGKRDIDLTWFKQRLQIENEYPDIYDLKKRVIDPAVKQINELTDLDVSYVQKKRGRVITSFFFTIRMKDADKPKSKLPSVDEPLIAKMARPGETRGETYHRIRAERAAAKKPARKKPVQIPLTGVDLPERHPEDPAVKAERAAALKAALRSKRPEQK